jgi:hypothetical protein
MHQLSLSASKFLFLKSCAITICFLPLFLKNSFFLCTPIQPGSMSVQPGFIRFFFWNFRFNRNFDYRLNREFTESSLLNIGSTGIRVGSTGISAVDQNQRDLICWGYKNLPPPLLNPKNLKPTPYDGCSPLFQSVSTSISHPKSFPFDRWEDSLVWDKFSILTCVLIQVL